MDFITLKWMVFLLDIRITPIPLQRSSCDDNCFPTAGWFILSNQAWMECPNSWSSLFELDISKTNNFTENNFWYEDIIFVDTNTLFSVSFYSQRFEIIKIPVYVMALTAAVPGPGEGQTSQPADPSHQTNHQPSTSSAQLILFSLYWGSHTEPLPTARDSSGCLLMIENWDKQVWSLFQQGRCRLAGRCLMSKIFCLKTPKFQFLVIREEFGHENRRMA